MTERRKTQAAVSRESDALGPILILAVALWAARYALSPGFGLYEDDFTIVPSAAAMSLREMIGFVTSYIASLRGHARPLSDSFIYLLSNLGWPVGGLRALYAIGFGWTLMNAGLFYTLVRRRTGPAVALVAGLAYVTFSADTTQAFLTHSLGLQPSLTLLFLAFHVYGTRGRPWAYALAGTILFAYETPYLLFLMAPFVVGAPGRSDIRRVASHVAVVLALMVLVGAFRAWVGEERFVGLSWETSPRVMVEHMLVGPAVSLGSYGLRLYQTATAGTVPAWTSWAIGWVLLTPILFVAAKRVQGSQAAQGSVGRLPMGIFGLVCLALAYPITFTTRATAISGRETRVHLAAVVGTAVIAAAGWMAATSWARTNRRRWMVSGMFSAVLAGQIGFGLLVQADYVRSWELQQDFWSQVAQLIPDASEGTVIIVDPIGLEDTLQIGANTWSLPIILEQIYQFPADGQTPPRVYRGVPEWREYLVLPDGSFRISGDTVMAPESTYTTIDRSKVIVLHSGGGRLRRREEPLVIDAVEYRLKTVGVAVLPPLARGFLYDLLLEGKP